MKLYEKSPVLRLTGLDASLSMVNNARKNIANAGLSNVVEIKKGNVNHMPFSDNSFDAVVSRGSIHQLTTAYK